MNEIHYYVHGRGRGHATRALGIAPSLQQAGYRVRVFAGGAAYALLSRHMPCSPIHVLLPGEPVLTLPKLVQRVLWATTRGVRRAPLAVISDGDLPSSVASRLVGVPVIAIGHGLTFSHAERPAGISQAPWQREANKASRASLGSTRQVLVNFCPLKTLSPSAVLARPLVPSHQRNAPRRGGVVCYFRDNNGQRALAALRACGITPRLFALANPRIPGVRSEPLTRPRFMAALAEADAVVSSAGHQLLAECLSLRVPQLALFAPNDDEQQLNVELLRNEGLGDGTDIASVCRADVLHFLGRLPELAALRHQHSPLDGLPVLEQVVVRLLAELVGAGSRPNAGVG